MSTARKSGNLSAFDFRPKRPTASLYMDKPKETHSTHSNNNSQFSLASSHKKGRQHLVHYQPSRIIFHPQVRSSFAPSENQHLLGSLSKKTLKQFILKVFAKMICLFRIFFEAWTWCWHTDICQKLSLSVIFFNFAHPIFFEHMKVFSQSLNCNKLKLKTQKWMAYIFGAKIYILPYFLFNSYTQALQVNKGAKIQIYKNSNLLHLDVVF